MTGGTRHRLPLRHSCWRLLTLLVTAVLIIAGCSDTPRGTVSVAVTGPDAGRLLRVDIAACYSDPGNGAELPVRLDQSGEPVRVDIDGSRTEDDCATSVDVVLDEPLGSRAVRVADTDTTYKRCDRGGEFYVSGDVELEVLCER